MICGGFAPRFFPPKDAVMNQKTLWMSNSAQLTSAQIIDAFHSLAPVLIIDTVKVKRNYCFVEFREHEYAKRALEELSGKEILGTRLVLNWATYSSEYSVFVGDLSKDVDESELSKLFAKYESLKGVKIIVDESQKSKGYGFVRFKDRDDQIKALAEMHGHVV